MKNWYRIQASPVSHYFPQGLGVESLAACGVVCTRTDPWKSVKHVGGQPCRACLEAQDRLKDAEKSDERMRKAAVDG